MSSQKTIIKYIRCIQEKNYAMAHKYLKRIVLEKVKDRIREAIKTQRVF